MTVGLWAPCEAALGPAGGLSLQLFLGPGHAMVQVVVDVPVVVQASRIQLCPRPGHMLPVAQGCASQRHHLGHVPTVGGAVARPGGLAARCPHDPLHVLVQDAFRVLLVGIPQPTTAHVHIAGWEVVPGRGRRQLVAQPWGPWGQVSILAFFLLWGQAAPSAPAAPRTLTWEHQRRARAARAASRSGGQDVARPGGGVQLRNTTCSSLQGTRSLLGPC